MRAMFGSSLAVFVLAAGLALPAWAQPMAPYQPVPQVLEEAVPPSPGPRMMWEPGHWHWNGGGYVWIPGHYIRAWRHAHFVPGHWADRRGAWVWVPSHWS